MVLVQFRSDRLQKLLFFFKLLPVVIPYDQGNLRMLDAPFHIRQMEKAFIAFRVFRARRRRQFGKKLHRQERCIDHFPFRLSGMDTDPAKCHLCGSRIEILIFQFSQCTAINRIGIFRTQSFQVDMIHTLPDFLIRRKADRDLSMRDLRRKAAIVMISATPALSSAPSSVVPSVTMRSCP